MAETAAPVQEIAELKIDTKEPASNGSAKPAEPSSPEGASFKDQFKAFSKFGDVKSDGKLITLSQSDKWMKQAGVIDKKITTTDTGIHFKKLKSVKVSIIDYQKFLDDLAKVKAVEVADIKKKLAGCGAPGSNSAAKVRKYFYHKLGFISKLLILFQATTKAADTVARLTDTSRYTGSHKQRFDETGKGKGIAGRKDTAGDGYVSGYQHKDSYDKTH